MSKIEYSQLYKLIQSFGLNLKNLIKLKLTLLVPGGHDVSALFSDSYFSMKKGVYGTSSEVVALN